MIKKQNQKSKPQKPIRFDFPRDATPEQIFAALQKMTGSNSNDNEKPRETEKKP